VNYPSLTDEKKVQHVAYTAAVKILTPCFQKFIKAPPGIITNRVNAALALLSPVEEGRLMEFANQLITKGYLENVPSVPKNMPNILKSIFSDDFDTLAKKFAAFEEAIRITPEVPLTEKKIPQCLFFLENPVLFFSTQLSCIEKGTALDAGDQLLSEGATEYGWSVIIETDANGAKSIAPDTNFKSGHSRNYFPVIPEDIAPFRHIYYTIRKKADGKKGSTGVKIDRVIRYDASNDMSFFVMDPEMNQPVLRDGGKGLVRKPDSTTSAAVPTTSTPTADPAATPMEVKQKQHGDDDDDVAGSAPAPTPRKPNTSSPGASPRHRETAVVKSEPASESFKIEGDRNGDDDGDDGDADNSDDLPFSSAGKTTTTTTPVTTSSKAAAAASFASATATPSKTETGVEKLRRITEERKAAVKKKAEEDAAYYDRLAKEAEEAEVEVETEKKRVRLQKKNGGSSTTAPPAPVDPPAVVATLADVFTESQGNEDLGEDEDVDAMIKEDEETHRQLSDSEDQQDDVQPQKKPHQSQQTQAQQPPQSQQQQTQPQQKPIKHTLASAAAISTPAVVPVTPRKTSPVATVAIPTVSPIPVAATAATPVQRGLAVKVGGAGKTEEEKKKILAARLSKKPRSNDDGFEKELNSEDEMADVK
jgi:hypothetical protein